MHRFMQINTSETFVTMFLYIYYNMVGLAVAMVIATMHENSFLDSHNARKFETKF